MKWSEITGLEGEISTTNPQIIWQIPRTKNGKSHNVALPSLAAEIIKSRFNLSNKHSVYVFSGNSKLEHFTDPKSSWKRILNRAKITNLRIHDLRRTLATNINQLGVNTITIKDVLGHSYNDVTPIYARTRLQTMFETLQKHQDFILQHSDGVSRWW
jgi:integrase